MKAFRWMLAAAAAASLFGCDQLGGGSSGGSGSSCKGDGDCKNGFLCEEKTCVPEAVAKKARAAGTGTAQKKAAAQPTGKPKDGVSGVSATAAPGGASTAVEKPKTCGDPSEVPAIPAERSDPPKGPEWDTACQINTQGANAQPPNCNMRILREWIMVTCRGDVLGYELMEDFGNEGFDYFKQINVGQMASFAVRLQKGNNQKVRICRKNDRASLFVSWPPSKDRPLHVALGRGPKCDGSKWGTMGK